MTILLESPWLKMDTSFPSITAAGILVLLTIVYYWIRSRYILPGPTGVPYLGLYPFLTEENAYLKFEEYKKVYGDVFSFTYTGKLYINLGSAKAMREILVNKSDCFADKYKDTTILTEILRNGVPFVNGEKWKVTRKFFIQKFKDYGLNTVRDNVAGPMYDSLNIAIEDLRNLKEKPVNIVEFLGNRCAMTMRKMLFGEKGISDKDLTKINIGYAEALEGNLGVNMLLIGPFARLLFTLCSRFRKSLQKHKAVKKLMHECVKNMECSMNKDQPTNIIEEFYYERNKRRHTGDPTWKYFSDDVLVDNLLQFIGDGIQAVAALIGGLLNALVENPGEQEKLYSEIMEVIGPNRQPAFEDRLNLPYTNAFINEYLRITSGFIPFLPSLECTKETSIKGYRIPKGSVVLLNFYSAHHDSKTFDNPTVFKPDCYMPSPEKPKAESPVLFGMGKRSCSGEPFVMLQVFIFLATIVKNFKVTDAKEDITEKKSADHILTGKFELKFVPRKEN